MIQVKHIIGDSRNIEEDVNKVLNAFAEKKHLIRDIQYSINNMTPFPSERFTAMIVYETDLKPEENENKSL